MGMPVRIDDGLYEQACTEAQVDTDHRREKSSIELRSSLPHSTTPSYSIPASQAMARHYDALCEELIDLPGGRAYSMPRPLAFYLVTTLSSM